MNLKYILNENKEPVPEPDLRRWSTWFEKTDRIVAQDTVDEQLISTVFLGLDHGWHGKPELFETMIFDEKGDSTSYQERYSTWKEAEEGHYKIVGYLVNLNPRNLN